MNQVRFCLLMVWLLLPAELVLAAPPREQTQACVAASTQGQTDRDEGRLLAAREQLLSCAREVCPSIVKKSCSGWLSELSARIPSVVVRVHEAGAHDLTDARVLLDGSVIALDGRPVALDPGTHTLSVDAAGFPTAERSFLLAEREQGRLLVVELQGKSVTATPALSAQTPPPVTPPQVAPPPVRASGPQHDVSSTKQAPTRFRMPIAGWVLGGLGVAGLVSFVALRSKAQSDLHELERSCSPTCSDRQRDHGKRLALAADVSLGIGIAAFGGAGAWILGSWLVQRRAAPVAPQRATLSLVPTRGGAFAAIATRY